MSRIRRWGISVVVLLALFCLWFYASGLWDVLNCYGERPCE
jgi:hypothetical protein